MNPRPTDYETVALPTELFQQCIKIISQAYTYINSTCKCSFDTFDIFLYNLKYMKGENMQIDNEKYENMMFYYNSALKLLETELNILIYENKLKTGYNPVEHIKSRIKSKESIIQKLKDKNLDLNCYTIIDNVYDVVGIRIICSFLTDIPLVLDIIKNDKNIKIVKEKDYINDPKDSGYRSYHLIVTFPVQTANGTKDIKAEIQIRTVAMDFWASIDHQIQYKFANTVPEEVKEKMYEYSSNISEIDKKMVELNELVNNYKEKAD